MTTPPKIDAEHLAAPTRWNGLLNIDKPTGITSRDVVDRVARLIRKTKVGHAGTLDPLATGVLVVCIGAATRLVDRVQDHPKGYRAGLRLGVRSDTDDSTGTLTPGNDPAGIDAARLVALLPAFVGQISQVPPKFSAVHVEGQRAYDLARADKSFEIKARTVQVDSIRLVSLDGDAAVMDIVCGSGTYIRSIIRDLGDQLGCGAVMTSLRRTFIGPFQAADALPFDQVTAETLTNRLQPLVSALDQEFRYSATAAECRALLQGREICGDAFEAMPPAHRVAVLDPTGELFAFAVSDTSRRSLSPQRVFHRSVNDGVK